MSEEMVQITGGALQALIACWLIGEWTAKWWFVERAGGIIQWNRKTTRVGLKNPVGYEEKRCQYYQINYGK